MIKINQKPVIARLLERKTCATLILTNVEELPVKLIHDLGEISFFSNMVNDFKDFICVVPLNKVFEDLFNKVQDRVSFLRIEKF